MTLGFSEKKDTTGETSTTIKSSNISIDESSGQGRRNVHYVNRTEHDSLPEYEGDVIPGYDATLMRARASLSSAEEKRLLRRIDWHLIPLLAVMYMLKSVDFTNVSWGVVLCCHAAVTNRQGLYAVRFFLGLFEAGLWPGMLVQLCYWYRPDEIAPRIVLVTLLVPSTASWLSEREQTFIEARLPSNAPRAAEANFNLAELITTLKNKRIWLFLLCWAFFTVGTTGLTFYQPTVIANLGFTSMGETQLLNIPSAVFAVILTVVFGILADTGRIPQPAIPLAFMIVIEACYGVLYAFPNTGGVYAATILAGGFSTAWYVMMWPWRVQTTEGATGSAFAIAFANSYGQIGGAVGSQLFNSRYAPRYATSFGIAMGFVGMAIIMNLITWGFTWKVDVDTRKLKRIRLAAAKQNQAVLDDVDIHAGEKQHQFNIYAYVGQNRLPDVLVTSHIDTVPPFIPYSLHAPASATGSFNRTDLVIGGRGTVDAKASVAAIVFAALETLAENPHASIGLLFDVGEENSGVGMKYFSNSELNPTPPTYHTVIFGEPTELNLVAAHKGTLGFKLVAEGKAAHSGYPWLGQSAISSLVPVLAHLDTLQDIPPEKGGLLRSETLGKSTLNIGLVHGGIAANVVPAHAEAAITVRLAAGAPEDTRVIVERAVANVTEGDESVYLDFGDRKSGAPPQYFDVDVGGFGVITVNYGTDAPALDIHDQEAPRVRRYLYGPGSILVAHADDEAITVGELEEAVGGYKRLIAASL
ncbi:major facilitator superfamily domain-containing protein [Aspergillus caelatus]|uniref:Major facilitator superfamily domain-containing protein n=1 Tax=Aspergillus caelatus TaxID=61420 RepID=A0A5N7AJU5_9EURO|nr:major facilitator superfamily domain-containing protein [Aspergillus caelatus]KAE8370147.1 major facilitator superfamily domain-containing protein [Aspergillus caelatus]